MAGRLASTPATGVAVVTTFRLVTTSWASSHLPLTYRFEARGVDVATSILRPSTASPELETVLPPGNLTVVATATDAYGARGEASAAVAVAAAPEDSAVANATLVALEGALAWDAPESVCALVVASSTTVGLLDALLDALGDARDMTDATSETTSQFAAALRAPVAAASATGPLSSGAAATALVQAKNLSRDLRTSSTSASPFAGAQDLTAVLSDLLESDLFAAGSAPDGGAPAASEDAPARRRLADASSDLLEAAVEQCAGDGGQLSAVRTEHGGQARRRGGIGRRARL